MALAAVCLNGFALDRGSVQKVQPHSRKVTRSVLRLSGGDSTLLVGGLKLSDRVSEEAIEADPQKASENRSMQLRFAAMMRDEDPEKIAENETRIALERIQALRKEAEHIKRQSLEDRRNFEEQQKKSLDKNWFIGLASLFLLCFAAMLWLAIRLRDTPKEHQNPYWKNDWLKGDSDEEDDRDMDDSPFSDTFTDLSVAQSSQASDVSVRPDPAHERETDAELKKNAERSTQRSTQQPTSAGTALKPSAVDASDLDSTKPPPAEKVPAGFRYQKRFEVLKVEEISDAMQEAEFWMSLNNPQRAITVLEHYGSVESPHSPMPWLYLFELYRGLNERTKYQALQQRFALVFNSKMPTWDAGANEAIAKGLEDMPTLAKQVCDLWGSRGVVPFLESLLFIDREGKREGFDLPVYLDLILLTNLAYQLYPTNRLSSPAPAQPTSV